MKKTTSTILAAAVSGLLVGATTGCTSEEKPSDSGGTSPTSPGGEQTPAAVVEKHACKGMNSCANKGASGKNDCAGKGDCATVAHHSCGGKNECKAQGGCKTAKHDCAGKNDCSGQGGCAVPVKMNTKK